MQSKPALPAVSEFARYLRTETFGGVVLLVVTVIAVVWANSPWSGAYESLRDAEAGADALGLHLRMSVGHWATDAVLALFFFVVGLELKRELVVGELSDLKTAALPIIAAVGGMIAPALIAVAISAGEPGWEKAWAVPMATDIAFALGVLAVTASHLPSAARVFLLSLAVVDDLGAIIVIAVVFTTGFDVVAALVALAALGAYAVLQKFRIRTPLLYVPIAVVTWIGVHEAGIHATIAGVALGLLTRVRPDPDEEYAPAIRLEHRLQPYSALLAVPLFALFAAGIAVDADSLRTVFTTAIPLAIMLGLFLGKIIGILGASALAVRLGIGKLPSGTNWRDIAALAVLGGVGFTVALLIADLALPQDSAAAKSAVLIASLAASLVSALLLFRRSRAHKNAASSRPRASGDPS